MHTRSSLESNSPFAAEKLRFPLPMVITMSLILGTVAAAFGSQQMQLIELRERQRTFESTIPDISAMRNDIAWIKEYLRRASPQH